MFKLKLSQVFSLLNKGKVNQQTQKKTIAAKIQRKRRINFKRAI
jgi:hypothetical protein